MRRTIGKLAKGLPTVFACPLDEHFRQPTRVRLDARFTQTQELIQCRAESSDRNVRHRRLCVAARVVGQQNAARVAHAAREKEYALPALR